jgi:cobalamin-dependent methionine synthase I
MACGDALRGYLLDRIGSIAVESLAQEAEDALTAEYAKKEKSVSMRFSPGYCDWAIEEQFKLSRILDFQKAGVKLTEKCMMVPKKSISAACAVGPKGLFSRKKSHCSLCAQDECAYRRD